MGSRRSRLAASTVLGLGLAAGVVVAAAEEPFWAGGIQVNEPDHERWLGTLEEVGLNTVAVTVYAKQGDWDAAHLWYERQEPAVLAEIRAAKARGLRVVLILRVALDHAFPRNRFFWHGMIMPADDATLDEWFRRYEEFALHWASVAEAEGVDLLGVGSEMRALSATRRLSRWGNLKSYHGHRWYQRLYRRRALRYEDELERRRVWWPGRDADFASLSDYLDARLEAHATWARTAWLRKGPRTLARVNRRRARLDAHWRGLIRAVREVYGGPLTYAANFDNYTSVGFWSDLDVVGINGYFPLRFDVRPDLSSENKQALIVGRWREIFDEIDAFLHGQGLPDKPFLFTELGYTTRRDSTIEPWAHHGFSVVGWRAAERRLIIWRDQPQDLEERSLALEGLWRVHRERRSALGGILYWKLSTIAEHDAIEPFVLHIGPDSRDPAQRVLVRFVEPDAGELHEPTAFRDDGAAGGIGGGTAAATGRGGRGKRTGAGPAGDLDPPVGHAGEPDRAPHPAE